MMLTRFYVLGLALILPAWGVAWRTGRSELASRSLTLLVLLHIVLVFLWLGPGAFTAGAFLVVAIGAVELAQCFRATRGELLAMVLVAAGFFFLLLAWDALLHWMFVPGCLVLLRFLAKGVDSCKPRQDAWTLLLAVVVPGAAALSTICHGNSFNLIAMILLVQFNDSFAYLGGSTLGRNRAKFVEPISPNKTLEGFWAGAVGTLIAGLLLHTVLPVYERQGMTLRLTSVVIVVFLLANAGDLAFSCLKRRLGVKDFSHLLAGHGGILDRFDSILCLAPAYLILVTWGVI